METDSSVKQVNPPLTFLLLLLLTFPVRAQSTTDEDYVNIPFFDDFDGPEINSEVWQIATWFEHGGQTGTERCYAADGNLNMIFINDSQEGFLSSAMQTRDEFYYGKWEARLKPSSVPGILNSMYTIDWNNTALPDGGGMGTKEEIDIEFLTNSFNASTGEVHYAVHAENRTSFNTNPDVPLDFNPSDDFHVWGFDITPEYIEWFVDDTPLLRYTYDGNDISITSPYQLKFNVWSAVNWIGGPPEADVECVYQIDWIRFTPRGSAPIISFRPLEKPATVPLAAIVLNRGIITYILDGKSLETRILLDASGRTLHTAR